MSRYSDKFDSKNEYEFGLSVEDIVSQFNEERSAAASEARYQAYLDSLQLPEDSPPEEHAKDSEGVRVYKPKKAAQTPESNFQPSTAGLDVYKTEQTNYDAPQYEASQYEAPQYEAPQYEAPQYEAPQYEAPQYEAPQYEAPQYEAPQYEAPQYLAPQYSEAQGDLVDDILRSFHESYAPRSTVPDYAQPFEYTAAPYGQPMQPAAEFDAQYIKPAAEPDAQYAAEPDAQPLEQPKPKPSAFHAEFLNFAEEKYSGYSEPVAAEPEQPATWQADEFDERIGYNKDAPRRMMYDGEELDLRHEDDYEPTVQRDYFAEQQPPPAKGRFSLFTKKEKKRKLNEPVPQVKPYGDDFDDDSFSDHSVSPGSYAPDEDYEIEDKAAAAADISDKFEADSFPGFGKYLAGLVSVLLLRLRGHGGASDGAVMEDDDEDLGTELPADKASRYYGSHLHSMSLRLKLAGVLLVIMGYVSLGLPVPGLLKALEFSAGFCLSAQLTIMLLCLDVFTGGIINTFRGRFGADSLAALACIFTSFDAAVVVSGKFGSLHMPFTLLSSLSLCAVMLASYLSAKGLRKALRVPAIGKTAYSVTGQSGVIGRNKPREITLLKSLKPATGFLRRCEEAPPDETLFTSAAPFLLIAAILLALLTSLIKKSWGDFLFLFTAYISPAVPVAALLSYALPFSIGTMRIFSSGAAFAGWSGICDIGQSKNLIVTDRDIFPDGSVELVSVRVFADAPGEKIIAYAGTMITASGSSCASCFADLMEKNKARLRHIENFEYLPGGGMKGVIDGEIVLCGGVELMRLMGVKIPYKLLSTQATNAPVLLAIDGILYGIFDMKYNALPQVRHALVGLMRSNRHPVFAIRDFNVTPDLIHDCFDLSTDGYDFPPYIERFPISEAQPGEDNRVAGVVCREGLGPLTRLADTGRSVYLATRINLMLTLLSAVLGMLFVFIKLLTAGSVSLGLLLAFMLVWAVPVVIISVFLKF